MTARRFGDYLGDTPRIIRPVRRKPFPAELQALALISHGQSAEMVAETLGKSPHTIRTQVRNARTRMAAKHEAHAIAICFRNGWLT